MVSELNIFEADVPLLRSSIFGSNSELVPSEASSKLDDKAIGKAYLQSQMAKQRFSALAIRFKIDTFSSPPSPSLMHFDPLTKLEAERTILKTIHMSIHLAGFD